MSSQAALDYLSEQLQTLGFVSLLDYRKSKLWQDVTSKVMVANNATCRFCNRCATEVYLISFSAATLKGDNLVGLIPMCYYHYQKVNFSKMPLHESRKQFSRLMQIMRHSCKKEKHKTELLLRAKCRNLSVSSYYEYLKSPHWAEMVGKHRQGSCYCCSETNGLELHHNNYDCIGSEAEDDLVTLCHDCHDRLHKAVNSGIYSLRQAHVRMKALHDYRRTTQKTWLCKTCHKRRLYPYCQDCKVLNCGTSTVSRVL